MANVGAKFPSSEWDGTSKRRTNANAERPPDAFDWDQIVAEVEALEGFLLNTFNPPKMTTTQRNAVSSPTEGMVIYNTTTHALNVYNGTSWQAVTAS